MGNFEKTLERKNVELLGKATDMVNKSSLKQINYDMAVFGAEAAEDKKDVVLVKLSMILELSVKQSFILLNFANMRKDSKIAKMSTTAHEIAHFILGNTSGRRNQERNADNLVEEWGFRRAYKNYSAFRCNA